MERRSLSALGKVLDDAGFRWVVIGAIAANRYRDAPRTTQDLDVLLADGNAEALERRLAAAGWQVRRASPDGEILRARHPTLGAADLIMAGTTYQYEAIARARLEPTGDGFHVRVLTIEDVILHKLIAGRPRDIGDIESILAPRPRLDLAYLEQWADLWEVREAWESLRSRFA